MKNWSVSELDKDMVRKLNTHYGLPVFTAMLLTIRNITEKEDIEEFFSHEIDLDDPLLIKDMDKAVERIRQALDNNEKICIYGDYDCDGVTSTAIMYSYLESCFADVMYYIPDRNEEGYGMNIPAIQKLSSEGIKLLITVDNGITAIDEIEYAVSVGMDVIVTDHHKPLDILPAAHAVVNPHRNDETYHFRDYSGAGLALKLIYALDDNNYSIIENYADLAALGTVADIVPLCGENRKIVKFGIVALKNTERPGLSELIEKSAINEINSGAIGFKIGPRINAAGRLGSPYDALNLFLTEDVDVADEKSEVLCELNRARQKIEGDIIKDIDEMIADDPSITENRIIVLASDKWNAGVIGIVSSRITERFGKPSVMISINDEVCKASGRSVTGFSLVDAVFACSEHLVKFGGHPMAVGFSIKKEKIDVFTKAVNEYADKLDYMPLYTMKLDCKLNPESVVLDMVRQLKNFEPFGCSNPKPIFGFYGMKLDKITPVGGGKHLRLSVSRGNARLSLMCFSTSPSEFPYNEGETLDFAVNIDKNEYMGKESLSFNVKDIRINGFDVERAMLELQDYELYKKGVFTKGKHDKFPTREQFAAIYRFLKAAGKERYTVDELCHKVNIDVFRLLIVLDIMKELNFIEYSRCSDVLFVRMCRVTGKTELSTSKVYRKLEEEIRNAR